MEKRAKRAVGEQTITDENPRNRAVQRVIKIRRGGRMEWRVQLRAVRSDPARLRGNCGRDRASGSRGGEPSASA